jgi:hypothetical protein
MLAQKAKRQIRVLLAYTNTKFSDRSEVGTEGQNAANGGQNYGLRGRRLLEHPLDARHNRSVLGLDALQELGQTVEARARRRKLRKSTGNVCTALYSVFGRKGRVETFPSSRRNAIVRPMAANTG